MVEQHLAPSLSIDAPGAFALGQPITLQVSLHNPSDGAMLLNGRLLVDEPEGLPDSHELEFTVSGPDGHPLPFMLDVNSDAPDGADFVSVAAGGRHGKAIRLDSYFRFKVPGVYAVTADYANTVAHDRDGVAAFVGRLTAAPVQVIVQE